MDQELEKYHKSNAELELSVSDLHLKQASLKTEVLSQRSALGAKSGHLQCFQHDLHDAAQSLQVRSRMMRKHEGSNRLDVSIRPDQGLSDGEYRMSSIKRV